MAQLRPATPRHAPPCPAPLCLPRRSRHGGSHGGEEHKPQDDPAADHGDGALLALGWRSAVPWVKADLGSTQRNKRAGTPPDC